MTIKRIVRKETLDVSYDSIFSTVTCEDVCTKLLSNKKIWFSVFQQCVLLSCLSTHIVCYFLLIFLSYFWFTTHGFGHYRKFRNSRYCDPDFDHENSPSCFTCILTLYGKYPRKACHVIRLLVQELSKINLRGITLEVIPTWRINCLLLS